MKAATIAIKGGRWTGTGVTVVVAVTLSAMVHGLHAQGSKGVHVCVSADGTIRYRPGSACPTGQTGYQLAEVEGDIKSPDEEKTTDKEIAELKGKVSFLTDRLSALERTSGARPNTTTASRVYAPFEVLDQSGNAILRVSANAQSDENGKAARILIARGASDNYGMFVRTTAGLLSLGLGVTRGGAGAVYVYDSRGKPKIVANGEDAISLLGPGGTEVAALSIGASGNGKLTLSDKSGQPMVTASMLSSKPVGIVVVGPAYKCAPNAGALGLGMPDCIVGRPPQE